MCIRSIMCISVLGVFIEIVFRSHYIKSTHTSHTFTINPVMWIRIHLNPTGKK